MSAIVEQALGLSYGAAKGEDDWNLWLDENLIKIGAVAQISVASMSEDTPPGVFVEGRRVIVGPSPTGAYAGQAGKLAVGVEGGYKFYTILKGWDFYNEADGKRYTWSGSAFVDVVAAGITGKQDTLVSGTNIKTVDGGSLLGSGNLVIGLQQFTEARVATAPHATEPLHTLTATGAEARLDIGIFPKGTGSFQLNSIATKRGAYAVDLQRFGTSSWAATGTSSAIGGGYDNRAQAECSTISGGRDNHAAGSYSVIGGGRGNSVGGDYGSVLGGYLNSANSLSYNVVCNGASNTASGGYAFVGNGSSNTASGSSSIVVGGGTNLASGANASIVGGNNNTSSGLRAFVAAGQYNTASGWHSSVLAGERHNISAVSASAIAGTYADSRANPGAAIIGSYYGQQLVKIFHGSTTSATPVELGDDFANPASYIMANQMVSCVTLQIAATDNTDNYSAWVEFLVKRGANAAATSIVGSPVVREIKSAGAATWSVTVAADTTNGGVKLTANGEAAKTIRWLCTFAACERK